jgi:phosphoribosyl-ATP pyrophosphohydrolase
VLLGYQDIPLEAVFDELRRRFGISGIQEKASRTP